MLRTDSTMAQRRIVLAALLVTLSGLLSGEETRPGWLQTRAGRIVDERGQPVLLRGVSLGLYPNEALQYDESDFERIRSWGFNVVRIPFKWSELEPRSGEYEEIGFTQLDQYIQWAKRHDLWVILSLFGWPPWWAQDSDDRQRLRPPVARICEQAHNSQLPLLVTEFGCHQDAAKAQPWIRDVLALWKKYDVGHLWWCYMKSDRPLALLDNQGQVRRHILDLLTNGR